MERIREVYKCGYCGNTSTVYYPARFAKPPLCYHGEEYMPRVAEMFLIYPLDGQVAIKTWAEFVNHIACQILTIAKLVVKTITLSIIAAVLVVVALIVGQTDGGRNGRYR